MPARFLRGGVLFRAACVEAEPGSIVFLVVGNHRFDEPADREDVKAALMKHEVCKDGR